MGNDDQQFVEAMTRPLTEREQQEILGDELVDLHYRRVTDAELVSGMEFHFASTQWQNDPEGTNCETAERWWRLWRKDWRRADNEVFHAADFAERRQQAIEQLRHDMEDDCQ